MKTGLKGMLAFVLVAVMLLSVCVSAQASSDEKITLRFSWWGSDTRHQATLQVIDMYMEQNPNVTIEAEYGVFDSFYEKLLTQLAGGTAPDIVSIDYQWTQDLIRQGRLFVDMNTLTDKIDMTNLDLDLAKSYGSDGDYLIGLAVGVNGLGYMYNVEFLDRFGITPSDDWTWEDVIENGIKVQEADSSSHLLYNIKNHWTWMIKAQLKQMNGNPFIKEDLSLGFTREEMIEIFTYIRRLVDTGTVMPFEESVLYETVYADQNPDWLNGKIGLFPTSSSHVPAALNATEFEVATFRFPGTESTVDSGILVTPAIYLSVYEGSKHVDQAADFINFFLNDEEAIRVLKDTRSVPANSKAKEILLNDNVISSQLVSLLEQASSKPGAPESSYSLNTEVVAVLENYVQQVGYGMMSPEQATDSMMGELEIVLSTLN